MGEIEHLPDLAADINDEHRNCERAVNAAVDHALKAGELLIEAKSRCPHGTWQTWLEESFEGSLRTAQAYMRVASNREEIEAAQAQGSAPLSLDGALKVLSAPKDEPQAPITLVEEERKLKAMLAKLAKARVASLEIAEDLSEANRRKAWMALGYGSLGEYVEKEFDFPADVVVNADGGARPVFEIAEQLYEHGAQKLVAIDLDKAQRAGE